MMCIDTYNTTEITKDMHISSEGCYVTAAKKFGYSESFLSLERLTWP